jgi:hypothetical protein
VPHGHDLKEWQPKAVKNVLAVVGIYSIFLGLSGARFYAVRASLLLSLLHPVLCFLGNAAKRKMRPAVRARRG